MGRGREDSALEAGFIRRKALSLPEQVSDQIELRVRREGRNADIYPSSLGTDADRRLVQIELERLASEGQLDRRYQLACRECGEFIGRPFDKITDLPLGQLKRCRDCKTEFTIETLDFWIKYRVSKNYVLSRQRIVARDRATIEKKAALLLLDKESFTASEMAEATKIPIRTVRPELALLIRLGKLNAHETICCRNCRKALADDQKLIRHQLGCLASCACGQEPFVVTEADVQVSYVLPGGPRTRLVSTLD